VEKNLFINLVFIQMYCSVAELVTNPLNHLALQSVQSERYIFGICFWTSIRS